MKGIKRFSVAALGLGVAGTLISAGMAIADPTGSPAANTRPLQGVGSDTSEEVMNALSEAVQISGQKVISSYNASGGAFQTRPTGCNYSATGGAAPARPNGSGQGRTALVASETVGSPTEGCLDFARSSSVGGTAGSNLTYIPFAKDAVAFAVTASSNLPRQLTLADLKAMYDCTYPGFEDSQPGTAGWQSTYKALLPQAGSGSRAFFYNTVLGYADSTLTGSPDTVRGCVSDETDRSGRGNTAIGIQEHRANVLDNNSIVPVSIGQFIAQSTGTSPSFIGKGVLGSILSTSGSSVSYPFALNSTYGTVVAGSDPVQNAAATRDLYNVVPTADLSDPEVDAVFTGSDSLLCQAAGVIAKYGFGTLGAECGSTTLTRNN